MQILSRLLLKSVRKPWLRTFYSFGKQVSLRFVYPYFPSFHHAVFVRLKSHLRRFYIKRLFVATNFDRSSLYLKPPFSAAEKNFSPKVSVIVPNYRHADFLPRRLESIYNQTYKNFEVILLDDASSDESELILSSYAARYPMITQCVFNQSNSGGVFYQWARGLGLAKGDLVWIAESDDYCSENFLEELVKAFENDAVMISYANTKFVDASEEQEVWSLRAYLDDLDCSLWDKPFVMSAHRIVNHAWGVKNIIPNVSSAVFRRFDGMRLLQDQNWLSMRICGDWIFYLNLIRGGLVSYTNATTNFYRIHKNNTSTATYVQDVYYQEHEKVAIALKSLYAVSDSVLNAQYESLKLHWALHRPKDPEAVFNELYSLNRIFSQSVQQYPRKPNLMMVGFAFSAGGGETFPIKLANLLWTSGYAVTFFNCAYVPTEPGIRALLAKGIPVLELDAIERLSAVVQDMGIEVIHSHHAWVDSTVCALLEDKPLPAFVITTHGMYEMISPSERFSLLSDLLRRVDTFVYTAQKNLEALSDLSLDEDRLVRIENALDIFPIPVLDRTDFGIPETAFVLCLVSRAIPEKGWEESIDAVICARNCSGADIHLLLIGEGDEYTRLKHNYNATPYIHFLGFQSNIRSFFQMADMGLLPSRFPGESFPLVVIDCLHAGRPVIASTVGEIPQMLSSPSGTAGSVFQLSKWEIPLDDLTALIVRYATDPAFYAQAVESVAGAVQKFDPALLYQKYDNVYMTAFSRTQHVGRAL